MKKFNLIISRGYMGLFYKEYTLATERMYLVASHPKLARAVADFNERNREMLRASDYRFFACCCKPF